jgi:predicted dehydrogenase
VHLAEAFAAKFDVPRWHAVWQDLIADRGVDAVYVATPVHLHAAQAIAAAESGKHVLCEKPMAMNAAECDRMIAACAANGVKLGIAYYRRFYPAVARIRQLIESGEIGNAVVAQMNAFEPFAPAPDSPRSWLLTKDQAGGGPMMDFGCHRVEVLLHLFGSVRSVAGVVANAAFEREVEDTAAALLKFERGTCATITVTHAADARQDTLDVFGTRGSIRVASLNAGELHISSGGSERRESHPPAPNVHQPLVEDFVDAVLSNRDPAVTGEMGRRVAAVEDAIYGFGPDGQ